MEKINLLWTGGWDSTYRMIELSRKNLIINPIYLYGDGRKSEKYERKAMDKIIYELKNKEGTIAQINPVEFIYLRDLPEDIKIKNAYQKLKEDIKMGSQHEYLAKYAKQLTERLEICIEKTPESKTTGCNAAIRKYGRLIESGDTSRYKIDTENSGEDLVILLGNLGFPIIDKTEKEMLEDIKKWNYEDIMKNIWFCHSPINEKPCGLCTPCKVKIESNMEFLLPKEAIRRYKKMKLIQKMFGDKVSNKYANIMRK